MSRDWFTAVANGDVSVVVPLQSLGTPAYVFAGTAQLWMFRVEGLGSVGTVQGV